MNEQPATPLKIDLRLALESTVAGLSFVLAGIAAVDLKDPYNILAPLVVGMLIVVINRLLGRSSEAAIASLATEVRTLIAQNAVFRTDATVAVKRQAEEAGELIRPSKPVAPITETVATPPP